LRIRTGATVRNQLLKQRLIQPKLGEVSISNGEVRRVLRDVPRLACRSAKGIKFGAYFDAVEASDATVDSARGALRASG